MSARDRAIPSAAAAPDERHLLAAIERLARAPLGWSAIALRLSRLAPPAPRPHHRRVARALMRDAAPWGDGQVFSPRNGDVVLLVRDGGQPSAPTAAALCAQLGALFGREAAGAPDIVGLWRLPDDGDDLRAYIADCPREPDLAMAEETGGPPVGIVDVVAAAIAGARPQDIVRRRAGAMLEPGADPAGGAMRLSYQQLTVSLDALHARLPAQWRAGPRIDEDAALLGHIGRYLDPWVLRAPRLDRAAATPFDTAERAAVALHLNLSPPGVLSDAFAELAGRCRADGTPLGVEIALIEAAADPPAFARAGIRARDFGARVVLAGVSHQALPITRLAPLRADLLKLDWSPRMANLPDDERAALAGALAEANPARIVLDGAETEAAVRWGLARGIRLFQGRHIDRMLAVRRMLGCPAAAACTPRQCADRAAATGEAGRAGCANPALLDGGSAGPRP